MKITLNNKTLFLLFFFVLFINISMSFACNTDGNNVENVVNEPVISSLVDDSVKIENNSNKDKIAKNTTNSVTIYASGDEKPKQLSQKNIIASTVSVNSFISKNGKLPNYVNISGYNFSMPEFMYLLTKTIQSRYKNLNSPITIKYEVKNPSKPTGANINGKISLKYYYDYNLRVAKYILNKNTAPNYVSTPLGKMQYQTAIYSFVKILVWSKSHSYKLPTSLSLTIKKSNNINKNIPKFSRTTINTVTKLLQESTSSNSLNDIYNWESLDQYLISTKNCPIDSIAIKSLATNITKNSKTNLEKATNIFNWVRDQIDYSFYYNTRLGAESTLSKRYGNCVDHSHLLIALCRSSGIPARYVHGTCKFVSGNVYGHVWVQILLDNTWVVADPISSKNSLGVVNNWYASSYKLNGKYNEITF